LSQLGYPVPATTTRVEEVVRRSRFVTDIGRASTVQEAAAFVERVRAVEPRATHHCWAYVVGTPGSTTQVGLSDDGEPHRTAGQPMLTTLLHSSVGDVVAVCTRYYGGVKLGTGGLARAYAGGVKHALDQLSTVRKVVRVPAEVTGDYADVDSLKRIFRQFDARVLGEEYGARVVFRCRVPELHWEALERAVGDATRGRGGVECVGDPSAD